MEEKLDYRNTENNGKETITRNKRRKRNYHIIIILKTS